MCLVCVGHNIWTAVGLLAARMLSILLKSEPLPPVITEISAASGTDFLVQLSYIPCYCSMHISEVVDCETLLHNVGVGLHEG